MLIRWLPLFIGLVPLIGVHAAYLIAVDYGYLQLCIPYLDGCTSISGTGRYPPASFLFKAVEMGMAVALPVFWYFSVKWLKALDPRWHHHAVWSIFVSGAVGALALIVYVTFLGTKEPFYEFMRRFGIYFYFLGTVLAQLFLAVSFRGICKNLHDRALSRMATTMLVLCLMPFAFGLLNLAQKSVLPYETADALENSIEWLASLMMQAYFVVVFFAWRRTGLAVSVSAAAPPGAPVIASGGGFGGADRLDVVVVFRIRCERIVEHAGRNHVGGRLCHGEFGFHFAQLGLRAHALLGPIRELGAQLAGLHHRVLQVFLEFIDATLLVADDLVALLDFRLRRFEVLLELLGAFPRPAPARSGRCGVRLRASGCGRPADRASWRGRPIPCAN